MIKREEVLDFLLSCGYSKESDTTYRLFGFVVDLDVDFMTIYLINSANTCEKITVNKFSYREFNSVKELEENMQLSITNAVEGIALFADALFHAMKFRGTNG